MCLGTVWDDLGQTTDPGVDFVPPPAFHLIVGDPSLLLPGGAPYSGVQDALIGTRRQVPRRRVGQDVTDYVELTCKSAKTSNYFLIPYKGR